MHTLKTSRLLLIALPILLTGCSGCTSQNGPRNVVMKPATPASGKFTIDGKPPGQTGDPGDLKNPPHDLVQLKLYPKGRVPQPSDPIPTAIVDANTGKYMFSTNNAGDGCPPGTYIITFESLNHQPLTRYIVGPDRFKNNFNNPVTQDLEKYSITIGESDKEVKFPEIDVKMSELVDKEPSQFATPTNMEGVR